MSQSHCINGLAAIILALTLCACAANAVNVMESPTTEPDTSAIRPAGNSVVDPARVALARDPVAIPESGIPGLQPLNITQAQMTGKLKGNQLSEVSGLVASARYPGLLYAINDSGNPSVLHAIDETGQRLGQWRINARNRDWEDMTRITLADKQFLVVGDTGDNLRLHKTAILHLFSEPILPATTDSIEPAYTIQFEYDDGPRNVEAFAAIDRTIYLLSKEPVGLAGASPSGIYQLELPESIDASTTGKPLIAARIGSMPLRPGGLESKLAAAFAGVDLSHPTALAFDAQGNTAYVLTYREVLRVRRAKQQSWAEAFAQPATRLLSHALPQAEALTLVEGRGLWFTSENAGAPLWAIPLQPPL